MIGSGSAWRGSKESQHPGSKISRYRCAARRSAGRGSIVGIHEQIVAARRSRDEGVCANCAVDTAKVVLAARTTSLSLKMAARGARLLS